MSKNITSMLVLGMVVLVAACSKPKEEEFVVVEPAPISMEPSYTGKYK
ncbi:MAG: hypothetical protein ACU0B7_06135 [Paracoccaceae bacterium]|nr:hypothetical protein [Seohaeicola saemankumensis]MCD1625484.1 hypothetical protein [Seohaeicola saemankumensis]